ncbi:MAG TPA: hypothetical protein HPP66_07600 [Planctomycetes bacterium]|nr:hypothetical protein [Planctomycetota bacterium]
MKNTTLVGCIVAVILAILCIVGVIFFLSQEETIPEPEWSYLVDESKFPYPVIDSNEKLEDISIYWYRRHPYRRPLKLEFVGHFPKVPDKMLLYKIILQKNVTEAYIRELAEKHFDMPTDAVYRRDVSYYHLNTDAYNFMYQAHNGFFRIFKHKKARENLSEDRKDYPSEEECIRIATEYLKERDLLPEYAYLGGVSGINIGSIGAMEVWFTRNLGQYKFCGHGSVIIVCIGVAGEITDVSKRWFEYQPYKLVPIRSPKEAFEHLIHRNASPRTSTGKATKVELAYHTPYIDQYIQPVYCFIFERTESYTLVPAIKPEYLKSHEVMRKEEEERRTTRIKKVNNHDSKDGKVSQ